MAMVRKQIYITPEQDDELKRQAEAERTTEAALVRRGIDIVTGRDKQRQREEAWQWLLKFMEERAQMKVPEQPRTWTRDELYDD